MNSEDENDIDNKVDNDKGEIDNKAENENKSDKNEEIEADIQPPSEGENDEPLTIRRKKKVPKKKSTLKMSNFEGKVFMKVVKFQSNTVFRNN